MPDPPAMGRCPPASYGAFAQRGLQIRIAFGLAFPPVYLVISRVFGNRSGYDRLWGLARWGSVRSQKRGLLLFLLFLTSGLSFLRKDNQRKGKRKWVRLSQGWESQTRKDNRRMRASSG